MRIVGGANNLLFRATGEHGDFAVKFTIRDSRDRAGREYRTLRVLEDAALAIAPAPVLVDQETFPQPVVVQTWLEGKGLTAPPSTDEDWTSLLEHFATLHSVTPHDTRTILPIAVLTASNIDACRELVHAQLNMLPSAARPVLLGMLIKRWEESLVENWPEPQTTLCRVDPNTSNIVCRPGMWASVDWENSGWGDPAFEIADLMSHPAYLCVDAARWEWVTDRYCRLSGDDDVAVRLAVYYRTMLVWWVARLARSLYEIPRGLDRRLVARPANWESDLRAKYQHYMALADMVVN